MGASGCASESLLPRAGGDGSLVMVIASTGVAVLGSFVFGVSIGYSAPTQSKIREDLQLSLSEYSVFGSIITIGAMIGAVASGHLADIAGRKGAMRTSALVCIVGWLAIFFAQAKVGRQKDFEIALQCLRGKDADVSIEAAEIKEFIKTIENLPKAGVQDLFNRAYIRPVIVGVGLMVFQQFVGINGILFYASETFVSAGFASGNLGTILMGCIQAPITAVGALLMDRSGRRPLLLISTSGLLVGSLLSAISFYLKIHGLFLEQVPIIALTGILVYIASYSIGMGAVPWVIMSEIFPINIKGIGGSFVTLVNWSGSWAVSFAFNFFMSWSSSGTFFLFALVCAVAILFIVKVVPETKGKTLEEIQASMNSST
uniref:Major facilitator superfamily (MFS) profile domain-containing protein n=1 Tax=Leersia perrieri TaxID=77586 RepID=A0A0D9XUN2_9ORYZ